MRAVIDWMQFTLPRPSELSSQLVDSQLFYVFDDVLGIPQSDFRESKTGINGYKKRLRFDNITVAYDGSPDMGVHVIFTGQGCRAYEQYCMRKSDQEDYDTGDVWKALIERVLIYSNKFSRIDVSIDDFKTYFPLGKIVQKLWDQSCTSLFDKFKVITSGRISSGEQLGLTIYLGSSTSDFQIVAYNKYLERISAGQEIRNGITAWNRWECRHYDVHAVQAATRIASGEKLGYIAHSKIHKYFNVLQPNYKDSNKSRWELWGTWGRFLGAVEKAPGEFVKPDKTILNTVKYAEDKMSKMFAKVVAYGGQELVDRITAKGVEKLNEEELYQLDMVADIRSSLGEVKFEDEDNQITTEFNRKWFAEKEKKKNNQPLVRID